MDGSAARLSPGADRELIKQLCLIADGETPDVASIDRGGSIRIDKPEGNAIVLIYICLLVAFPWVCRKSR